MITAGSLDRRIRIERATTSKDAFNEDIEAWATLATVWAAKIEIPDGEVWRASEVSAQITTRFQIRWNSVIATVDERDRIVYEGRVFDITRIKEIGRREGREITAHARSERPA